LADATEIPYDYHPTQGVRILEFEMDDIEINNERVSRDIELWDCSGNHKYSTIYIFFTNLDFKRKTLFDILNESWLSIESGRSLELNYCSIV
jgi:hypothetical protein